MDGESRGRQKRAPVGRSLISPGPGPLHTGYTLHVEKILRRAVNVAVGDSAIDYHCMVESSKTRHPQRRRSCGRSEVFALSVPSLLLAADRTSCQQERHFSALAAIASKLVKSDRVDKIGFLRLNADRTPEAKDIKAGLEAVQICQGCRPAAAAAALE